MQFFLNKFYNNNRELQEKYDSIKLSGKAKLLYCHNKKNPLLAYLLLLFSEIGLHRFYLGDKFSKFYGIFWLCMFVSRKIIFFGSLSGCWWNKFYRLINGGIPDWSFNMWLVFSITVVMYIVDLFLLYPTLKHHNLLLKKNIIENKVQDNKHYRRWIYCLPFLIVRAWYELFSAFSLV